MLASSPTDFFCSNYFNFLGKTIRKLLLKKLSRRFFIVMKKSALAFILAMFVLQTSVFAQVSKDYEKWGRIAVDIAKLNYEGSDVSDYQYLGRENISEERIKDTFKLEVKSEGKTFDVKVSVFHNPKTNSLLSVDLQEMP